MSARPTPTIGFTARPGQWRDHHGRLRSEAGLVLYGTDSALCCASAALPALDTCAGGLRAND